MKLGGKRPNSGRKKKVYKNVTFGLYESSKVAFKIGTDKESVNKFINDAIKFYIENTGQDPTDVIEFCAKNGNFVSKND